MDEEESAADNAVKEFKRKFVDPPIFITPSDCSDSLHDRLVRQSGYEIYSKDPVLWSAIYSPTGHDITHLSIPTQDEKNHKKMIEAFHTGQPYPQYIPKPVILKPVENLPGIWANEENTMIGFDDLENIPELVSWNVKRIMKSDANLIGKTIKPRILTNKEGKALFVYEFVNMVLNVSIFARDLVDAAMLADDAKMMLADDNGPLLVVHDKGYFLISPITLEEKKEYVFI